MPARRAVTAALAVCALALLAAGCTTRSELVVTDGPTTPPVSTPPVSTAPPDATVTPTPAPTSPQEPAGQPGGALQDRLITADDLDTTAGAATWTVATTFHQQQGPLLACARYAMTSIGAERVAGRTLTSSDGATAAVLVARFPDRTTAARGWAVLLSWQAECGQMLPPTAGWHVAKGLHPVAVDAPAEAAWYAVRYHPADQQTTFVADGIVHDGVLVSLLELRSTRRPSPDQVTATVQACAAHLAG